jgi:hypothetical protein
MSEEAHNPPSQPEDHPENAEVKSETNSDAINIRVRLIPAFDSPHVHV